MKFCWKTVAVAWVALVGLAAFAAVEYLSPVDGIVATPSTDLLCGRVDLDSAGTQRRVTMWRPRDDGRCYDEDGR